jgi:hypothetical protein
VMVAWHGRQRMGRSKPVGGGRGARRAGGRQSGARRGGVRLWGEANECGRVESKRTRWIASESYERDDGAMRMRAR